MHRNSELHKRIYTFPVFIACCHIAFFFPFFITSILISCPLKDDQENKDIDPPQQNADVTHHPHRRKREKLFQHTFVAFLDQEITVLDHPQQNADDTRHPHRRKRGKLSQHTFNAFPNRRYMYEDIQERQHEDVREHHEDVQAPHHLAHRAKNHPHNPHRVLLHHHRYRMTLRMN